MTGRPLLTLIVPAYNAANYLPNCLDDLLAQTFRDFEVLVMDDEIGRASCRERV